MHAIKKSASEAAERDALAFYVTDNLMSKTSNIFTVKNVTKISISFLQQKFLCDGV